MMQRFRDAFLDALPPNVEFASLRLCDERQQRLSVRDGVAQPLHTQQDRGIMVTTVLGGGLGYAATQDLSATGIGAAVKRALRWAEASAGASVHDYSKVDWQHPVSEASSPQEQPWEGVSLSDKLGLLQDLDSVLSEGETIASREASLWHLEVDSYLWTNGGGEAVEFRNYLAPDMRVTAFRDGNAQTRSMGLYGDSQQGGFEVLERVKMKQKAHRFNEEAQALLDAPNCEAGKMDIVLMPDQMMLQIHESIGHPIELDRILGDERNYAGTSFVTPDMFGSYQYGSELLNVTFDPGVSYQLASYAVDDEGNKAERVHVIKDGVLVRPLGSLVSESRMGGMKGTANARASTWNRPAIDRMANLNVEPGESTMDELVGGIESGVLMETNCSWSIDDSRNKFQFGCEIGWKIEDGEKKHMVRNPNYRGISANFWRSLSGVGAASTFEVLGTPFCGKGEPNQVIRVGHASPACRFSNVEVFGGA